MKTVKNVPRITGENEKDLWFHGSPSVLTAIRSGSTITANKTLAMVFSHKPFRVLIEVAENEDTGVKTTTIRQDGTRKGYLYRVVLDDPGSDTREDPESVMFPSDEVLTTRELQVVLIKEVPLKKEYTISNG